MTEPVDFEILSGLRWRGDGSSGGFQLYEDRAQSTVGDGEARCVLGNAPPLGMTKSQRLGL